jgi:UDP-N-acetylmuramyl pentapeptide phosphotransferase/UDP-N-acetylglucosamine-1-phosphate transferase
MIALLSISFFVSAFTVMVLMRMARRHARRYGVDMPQRFHMGNVPRLGGAGIFIGSACAWLFAGLLGSAPFRVDWSMRSVLLLCVGILPAVMGGVAEDMTQRLSARVRLALTTCSAILLCWALGLAVSRLGMPVLDQWLQAAPILAFLIAVLAISGLPHAFNLIDGYNGLAGTVAVIICLALAHVALQLGDRQLAAMLAGLIGATLGFLLWNYPHGKIFAGDGGAYMWGLVIAVASIQLVQRHSMVSPWFPMLLLIYPVWETLFSIYRKAARGISPGTPDALHFHQLVFRRIVRPAVHHEGEARQLLARNNRTSPYMWIFTALTAVPGVLFWHNTPVLMAFSLLFVVSYVVAYLMIIRFKVPRWLRK